MVICDKKQANARPLSSFAPGDVFTALGEYYMVTDNNVGVNLNPEYQICVNIQTGSISIFNRDYLAVFAPSEVYVE